MKKFYPALFITGIIVLMLSFLMTLPVTAFSLSGSENWPAFVISASLTFVAGVLLIYIFKRDYHQLQSRQLFLITVFSWIAVSLFSSIPFILCREHFSVTDAVFESISGITTTGSTVLINLDNMSKDILLWRSLLQWIGGIGIIAMAIAVLPFLHVGGMRLFKTESSDWSEKSHPRAKDATKALVLVYILLSIICTICYLLADMSLFDAVNHAMTTISTGGYSTHDMSIGHFHSSKIQWIAIVFMILGSMPFLMYVRFFSSLNPKVLLDTQVAGFLTIVTVISVLMTLYIYHEGSYYNTGSITPAFFNVISVISTTGYSSTDYSSWGPVVIVIFFLITFIGGCSGSTSGGMKIFRFQLSYMMLKEQINKAIHPSVILKRHYNNRPVDEEIITSAVAFSYLFLMTFGFISILLAITGLDFITSISGAATALANVGPGLGNIIGPAGNFQPLPDSAKWVLCAGMLLGRLELFTIIVIFTREFWDLK